MPFSRRNQTRGYVPPFHPMLAFASDGVALDCRTNRPKDRALPPDPSPATVPAEAVARALYEALLLRGPDAEGLAFHAARLAAGYPVTTAMQEFVGSGEFSARFAEIARAYNLPVESPRPPVALEALYGVAERAWHADDTPTAGTLCEAVLALDPHHRPARLLLAEVRQAQWRPDLALECYAALLAEAPEDTDALFRAAMLLGRQGCHAARIGHLRQLVRLHPKQPQNWFELGHAHLLLGHLDLALACFRRLGAVSDPYWLAIRDQALRQRTETRREALALLRGRVSQDGPRLVLALVRLGRLRAARALLAHLRPVSGPLLAEAEHALLRRQGRIDAALAALRNALPQRPDLAPLLAQACLAAGEFRAADTALAGAGRTPLLAGIAVACPELRPTIGREVAAAMAAPSPPTAIAQAWLTLELAEGRIAPQRPVPSLELAPPNPRDIPFRVFQYWNSPQVPDDVAACLRSWTALGGVAEHVLFDDAAAEAFLLREYDAAHAAVFRRCYHPAMRSDFIRLAYLYRHGGIYADADEMCAGPLWGEYQSWKHAPAVLVLDDTIPAYLHNWFIAARPGARLLGAALEDVMARLDRPDAEARPDIWQSTGPGLVTRAFARTAAEEPAALLSVARYRRICRGDTRLAYKATPEGNWRMAR